MSTFSALNVFKSLSKATAQLRGRQLSETREQLSLIAGFASYHDLQSVGQRRPDDARLLRFVFGVERFEDVVSLTGVAKELDEHVTQLALRDELAPKTSDIRFHMGGLFVQSRYDEEKGLLFASGEAELTCIEQVGYTPQFAQQFRWFTAILNFEVKFREQRWQLVPSSFSMRLEEIEDDDDFLEDSIDDFPSSEFWNL
ncbi:hypothetical protein [Pseudomonas sp. Gutcm_11s]|uniref:hypothetical protein n=1 Tax=Pseudomonas sp. Gutcm_11s TaxID=3026088 RepID=UPI00235F5D16|nr:hypothetical protein [Pseudomonas sp. Gutcm_11s]MDD0843171.1 hypothetical protein [Pseudomonas sp. Gutcm_11s]